MDIGIKMPKKKKITQQVSGRSSMRTEDWDSQIIAYCVLHPVSQYYTYMKHILPKKKNSFGLHKS